MHNTVKSEPRTTSALVRKPRKAQQRRRVRGLFGQLEEVMPKAPLSQEQDSTLTRKLLASLQSFWGKLPGLAGETQSQALFTQLDEAIDRVDAVSRGKSEALKEVMQSVRKDRDMALAIAELEQDPELRAKKIFAALREVADERQRQCAQVMTEGDAKHAARGQQLKHEADPVIIDAT